MGVVVVSQPTGCDTEISSTPFSATLYVGRFGNRLEKFSLQMDEHLPGPLFRPEVADARKQRLEGEIILAQPVRTHMLVLLVALIVGVIAAWIVLGQYSRTETAPGILVTNVASAKVVAIRPGVVSALVVEEGTRVEAGQRLAVVQVEQADESGRSAIAESLSAIEVQRVLAEQQQALAGARATGERARIAATLQGVRQQRDSVTAQLTLQRELIRSAQDTLDRIEKVAARGFVSKVELERRRQAMLITRQEESRLIQQLDGLNAQEGQARAELASVGADMGAAVSTAKSGIESLAQQRAQLGSERAYTIVAPTSGRVTALQASVGRTVDANVPLMVIVPEGTKLHADVYAPTRAIGFVKPGQEVRLLYDAFPYQRFGSHTGRITRISRIVIDPRELNVPMKIEEAVYRIEVEPLEQRVSAFGEDLPLQPGMTLSANLVLDRRSFGDWLLEPLNAVLKRSH